MPSPSRQFNSLQLSGILTGASAVTYVVSVQTDNGLGSPSGTNVAAGQQVVFGNSNFNPVFSMSPGTLSAGATYHIVVQYGTGPVSPTNNFAPLYSTPFHQIIPLGQILDPGLNVLESTDGGSTWIPQSFMPVFSIGFSDGSFYGNPYDTYTPNGVYGPNEVGEVFTAPAGGVYTGTLFYWIRKAGSPADNLYCEIDDLTSTQTVYSNIVANPLSIPATDNWVSTGITPIQMAGGHQFRIGFKSPGSTDSGNAYFFDTSQTTGPATLTFDGTNSVASASTDSGLSWAPQSAGDIGFYFNIAPTPTPTWTPQDTFTPNPTDTPPCAPAFGTFGLTTVGNSPRSLSGTQIRGSIYTLSEAATITALSAYLPGVDPSSQVRFAVYNDNAGSVSTLVAQSAPQQAFDGWNTISVPPTLLNPGNYWLMFMGTTAGSMGFSTQTPGFTNSEAYVLGATWGNFTTTLPSVSYTSSWQDVIYAAYCPVTPYTATPTPTNSPTPTPTDSPTSTPTSTPTVTPTIPATANFSVSDNVFSPSAMAGGLLLFRMDYNYGLTGSNGVTLFTTVPANTTLVETGPPSIAGGAGNGAVAGSPVSWFLPSSSYEQTGSVYMLVQVNGGTTGGTQITSAVSLDAGTMGSMTSLPVTAVVGPSLGINKAESASSANPGDTVTYTINWNVVGETLNLFDSYDYDSSGSTVVTGYDGTAYNAVAGPGSPALGTWTVNYDAPSLDNSIIANGGGSSPFLLRNNPTVTLLNGNYSLSGSLYLDPANSPNPDSSMVLAWDSVNHNGYVAGLSAGGNPGNLYLMKLTGGAAAVTLATVNNASLATPIQAGNWYTLNAFVANGGGSAVTLTARVWARGQAPPTGWAVTVVDVPSFSLSANYQVGWQADGGTSAYDNLQLYTPNGAVNPAIVDTLPAGLTYLGANPAPSQISPFVMWSFPGTLYGGSGSYSLAAQVASSCVTAVNQAAMNAGNAATRLSNPVTLTAACFTNTATSTPTYTPTATASMTPTDSATATPTWTPTLTATSTATLTATPTPTDTATSTPTETATNTASFTPTSSATPTPTWTSTMTATDSATGTATSTVTFTPTSTDSATATPTSSPTPTATSTATLTATPTPTDTATSTPTETATNTASFTPTSSATATPTQTFTATATNSETDTPTFTVTATPSDTSTATLTATVTPTPTATNTATSTATFTATPTPTPTATSTPTATATDSPTRTSTSTPTFTPTLTDTPTVTPTFTPTGSVTSTPTPDAALYLDVNFFNPNSQQLGMDLRVDKAGHVKVMVFNIAGEEVEKLLDQDMTPGNYRVYWDGRNIAGALIGNAVYFVTVVQPSGTTIRKVIVLK